MAPAPRITHEPQSGRTLHAMIMHATHMIGKQPAHLQQPPDPSAPRTAQHRHLEQHAPPQVAHNQVGELGVEATSTARGAQHLTRPHHPPSKVAPEQARLEAVPPRGRIDS